MSKVENLTHSTIVLSTFPKMHCNVIFVPKFLFHEINQRLNIKMGGYFSPFLCRQNASSIQFGAINYIKCYYAELIEAFCVWMINGFIDVSLLATCVTTLGLGTPLSNGHFFYIHQQHVKEGLNVIHALRSFFLQNVLSLSSLLSARIHTCIHFEHAHQPTLGPRGRLCPVLLMCNT
jgi:hypothetical protein